MESRQSIPTDVCSINQGRKYRKISGNGIVTNFENTLFQFAMTVTPSHGCSELMLIVSGHCANIVYRYTMHIDSGWWDGRYSRNKERNASLNATYLLLTAADASSLLNIAGQKHGTCVQIRRTVKRERNT